MNLFVRRGERVTRIAGFVDRASDAFVDGWVDPSSAGEVEIALVADGVMASSRKPDHPRTDAQEAGFPHAQGFQFSIGELELTPGRHVFQVVPILNGKKGAPLCLAGTENDQFGVTILDRSLLSPNIQDILIREYGTRPEFRRLFVADRKIRLRPDRWSGEFIFVDGLLGSQSSRYRIDNIVDELLILGYDCCILDESELWRIEQGHYQAAGIHFFRAPLWKGFDIAAKAARGRGSRIGYDIDDLAFDPDIMPYIDGLRFLSIPEIEAYRSAMPFYRSFIEYADLVTTSTIYLTATIKRINKNTHVVRNSITRLYLTESYGQRNDQVVRIGYFSGTKTHQADFGVASRAVARVLDQNPNTVLRIVGDLDLSEFRELEPFAARTEKFEIMPHREMLRNMSDCHIAIAPLEIGNPYCEAKSELKYFEAALVGIPIVASATDTFERAISDGKTGFLARSTEDWEKKLLTLVRDRALAKQIGDAAGSDVRENYHSRVSCQEFLVSFGLADSKQDMQPKIVEKATRGKTRRREKLAKALDVGFVVPPLLVGGGGHRKILRICHDMESLGHSVTTYVMDNRPAEENGSLIRRHFYWINGQILRYNGCVRAHDALVATSWETAYAVRRHKRQVGRCVYFIQDFEPMFMPVGSGYLKAIATYEFGFENVCLGGWIAARLKRELGVEARTVPFPLDKTRYHPPRLQTKRSGILFYARPNQERRGFELGIEALQVALRTLGGVQVGFFGEPEYPAVPFHFVNHGLIADQNLLAGMYQNAGVGVCFSPTNPSLVTYEMAACGCAVLDVALPDANLNFGGNDVQFLAEPTPEGIASALVSALTDHELRDARTKAGIGFTSGMITDDQMVDYFLDCLNG